MSRDFSFTERLRFSEGRSANTPEETIRRLLVGCVNVERVTNRRDQRAGIDFRATLRAGATVLIDQKARDKGCSRHWDECYRPELALEIWSVKPSPDCPRGVVGWTLDEAKETDYTLHTFDPSDHDMALLIPFQLLRIAFRRYANDWGQYWDKATQTTREADRVWQSECVFVPWCVVLSALNEAMEWAA